MNAKFELETIGQNTLVTAFESETGIKAIVENIQKQVNEQVEAIVWDLSKKKDRDLIASLARKVASSKTAIDAAGKQLKEQYTVITSKIDADRKFARDTLDVERDRIRQPLTDWENAEKNRKAKHESAINEIRLHATDGFVLLVTAELLLGAIGLVDAIVADSSFEEYEQEAKLAKLETLEKLRLALIEREKYEAEQAEIEHARIAEQQRIQQEHEAKIAREAAEKATREAEEKARFEAERVQREKAESEQREAQLKADKEAAEIRAAQAAENERKRIEAEQFKKAEAERKAEESRLADVEHRRAINREALEAIKGVCPELTEQQVKSLVGAIIGGLVPHVSIKY